MEIETTGPELPSEDPNPKNEPYSIPYHNTGTDEDNHQHVDADEKTPDSGVCSLENPNDTDKLAKAGTPDGTADETTEEDSSEVEHSDNIVKELEYDPAVPIIDIEPPDTSDGVDLVPKMAGSLIECGLLHPVTITPNIEADLADQAANEYKYRLLAGRMRFLARSSNLEKTIPAIIVYGDRPHLTSVAAQENLVRRKLTCLDQALLLRDWQVAYEQKCPETKKGGDTTQKDGQNDNLSFCKYVAERTPYNCRTAQRLVSIAKGLTPEAVEVLKLGAGSSGKSARMADHQSSLELLVKEFKHDDTKQKPAVLQSQGNPNNLQQVIEKLKREELKQQTCDWVNENISLMKSDFREVGNQVLDQSVDLILTDAPWKKEYVHLGEALGSFADRVLKPGKALVMMLGQATQLPFLELIRKHLTDAKYDWWEIAYLHKDNGATLVHSVKVASKWKPIWVAVKRGKNSRHVIPDLIEETGGTVLGGGKDKTYHEWGQSPEGFQRLIEYLTKPGDLVVDPFVGGGATAVAALRTTRRFIGIDVDEVSIKMTRIHLEHEDKKPSEPKNTSISDLAPSSPVEEIAAASKLSAPDEIQSKDTDSNTDSEHPEEDEVGEEGQDIAA